MSAQSPMRGIHNGTQLLDLPVKTNGNFKFFILLASKLDAIGIATDASFVHAAVAILIRMEQVEIVVVVVVVIVRRIRLKNCRH
jgi:hypothetical protein